LINNLTITSLSTTDSKTQLAGKGFAPEATQIAWGRTLRG
jgi:hypothetical protein